MATSTAAALASAVAPTTPTPAASPPYTRNAKHKQQSPFIFQRPHIAAAAAAVTAKGKPGETLVQSWTQQPLPSSNSNAPQTPWWLTSDAEHAHTACPLRPFAHMVVALPSSIPDGSSDAGKDSSIGSTKYAGRGECNDCLSGAAETAPGGAQCRNQCACATQPPLAVERLISSRIVHLSDALRRKMNSVTTTRGVDSTVGDILQFAAGSRDRSTARHPATRMRSVSTGIWNMLGWLVGVNESSNKSTSLQTHGHMRDAYSACTAGAGTASSAAIASAEPLWPYRRREPALVPNDDPLLVGNEGLGTVELAAVKAGKHGCVFALCAHALSPDMQREWLAWHAWSKHQDRRQCPDGADHWLSALGLDGMQLAIIHVAEVSTLHRVACHGIDYLMPPSLPLEQYFGHLFDSGRPLGPPPMLPPLLKPESSEDSVDAAIRWISLLVSRHGLVEMAYPLGRTPIVPTMADADSDDLALETGPPVALGSYLGESIFSRIHPEDVVRVVKALRLAWDARPDVYHFSRLRREWQRRRLSSAGERAVASAPSTPPLRPHRAATMSAATIAAVSSGGRHASLISNRQVYHREGIEVSNGVVELNVQIQLTGTPSAIDWNDPESMSEHTRFARMKLTRWPLILKPPRTNSTYRTGMQPGGYPPESEEPQDGFVLIGLRPLPEPSRTRSRSTAEPYDIMPDLKKLSISSTASTSTLIGLGVGSQSSNSSMHDSSDLVRLCRSASSLSCQETTARPSIEFADAVAQSSSQRGPSSSGSNSSNGSNATRAGDLGWPSSIAIPMARPVVGLSNNAVQTATGMSPHLTMRRRSNITVGSQQRNNPEEGLAARMYGTPCEFTY
ncbi:hypothetical protein GGI25_001135 [Coemansia spiralis]|uniref:Uncharacterized protein n=2 Tax=Coemansia TaxID=4863 RepID=A0A9W8GDD6_9FUNG|nr:hypothetical protein EDC05_000806 [Coemansia umbellata]KAJ2625100.1 hypothetical protein GGI26_000903 [Coemansia sp. RSA 1358]KAJ2679946.1 hypothetical protein GGI25_001135 [Coemansia spiralis]